MSTTGGPDPLAFELQCADSSLAAAIGRVEAAIRLAAEPERSALQYLRADLGASARGLGNLLKIAGRG